MSIENRTTGRGIGRPHGRTNTCWDTAEMLTMAFTVITNPEDPKFDLEAYFKKLESS